MMIITIKIEQMQNPPELCVPYKLGHVASFSNPLSKNALMIISILE